MGDTYAICIYNLQFTIYKLFLPTKKIMGDTYVICIYNLQFTNFFCQFKKTWMILMHLQFTIYKLFLPTKKNHG